MSYQCILSEKVGNFPVDRLVVAVADMKAADLTIHSRFGHTRFRVAQQRLSIPYCIFDTFF
jgi:hypothetical protein